MRKMQILLTCLSCALLCMSNTASASSSSTTSSSSSSGTNSCRGKQGPRGFKGDTGPRGFQGRQGEMFETFISVAASGTPANAQTVNSDAPILFNTVIDSGGDLTYNPTTGVFTTTSRGTYEITFGGVWVNVDEETTNIIVALYINGVRLDASRVRSNDDWTTMSVIVDVPTAPTTFEIRNDPDTGPPAFAPMQLFDATSGALGPITTAFATIKKIDN